MAHSIGSMVFGWRTRRMPAYSYMPSMEETTVLCLHIHTCLVLRETGDAQAIRRQNQNLYFVPFFWKKSLTHTEQRLHILYGADLWVCWPVMAFKGKTNVMALLPCWLLNLPHDVLCITISFGLQQISAMTTSLEQIVVALTMVFCCLSS